MSRRMGKEVVLSVGHAQGDPEREGIFSGALVAQASSLTRSDGEAMVCFASFLRAFSVFFPLSLATEASQSTIPVYRFKVERNPLPRAYREGRSVAPIAPWHPGLSEPEGLESAS